MQNKDNSFKDMLLSSLKADINEFLNSLYNTDRKAYIVKRVGPHGALSGNTDYTDLEDEAWKEFSLHFPFDEWKEKIIVRPDIARKIRQLRDAKLDEIVDKSNKTVRCIEILSNSLDAVINKTGLHTLVLDGEPIIVTDRELRSIDLKNAKNAYYTGSELPDIEVSNVYEGTYKKPSKSKKSIKSNKTKKK